MSGHDHFHAGFFEDENASRSTVEMRQVQSVLSNQSMNEQIEVDGKKDVLADLFGNRADSVMIRKIVFAGGKYKQLDILIFLKLFLNFIDMPSDSAFPGKEIVGKNTDFNFVGVRQSPTHSPYDPIAPYSKTYDKDGVRSLS